jgi:hypothetical protein
MISSAVALLLVVQAQQPEAAAKGPAADASTPKAFSACVEAVRDSIAKSRQVSRRCTWEYANALPQGLGGTMVELQNRSRSVETADGYIERELVPAFERRLRKEVDSRGDFVLAKSRMLGFAVSAARLYDQGLCDLVDEGVGTGTYRRIAAANCRIRNRDRLIEDLIWAQDEITQAVGE